MSLLSKFSKVEKNFLGQCNCLTWNKFLSLQNPALFRILAFSRIYEVPTLLLEIPLTTMTSWTRWKKMAASVKPKQNGGLKEHFCVGILLVFLENTCFHIEKAPRKTTALWSFEYADGEANRCNRFLVAEGRNHEGKPYFKGYWEEGVAILWGKLSPKSTV